MWPILAVLSATALVVGARAALARAPVAKCDSRFNITGGQCFVIDGSDWLGPGFAVQGLGDCCSNCSVNPACIAFQYRYPTAGGQCRLLGGKVPPAIKRPVHPSQKECYTGMLPPPPPPPFPPHPAGARSILYILVDDLRTQLGAYGHQFMHTPHLDQLAKDSMVFEQAHVNSQMCVPTRNSFMSGRRPQTTRVLNDGAGQKSFRVLGANWTALPQFFKERGYFTSGTRQGAHRTALPAPETRATHRVGG